MKTNFYDIESLQNVFTLCNFENEENRIHVYYLIDTESLYAYTINQSERFCDELAKRIYEKNQNFTGTIIFHDLRTKEANDHLARVMGLSDAYIVNNPNIKSSFDEYDKTFRPVCDTDENYDNNIHPYLFGYNSFNYDTTMLAQYFYEVYPKREQCDKNGDKIRNQYAQPILKHEFESTKASAMRRFNDQLFLPDFKDNMKMRLTRDYYKGYWSQIDWNDSRYAIRNAMIQSGRHVDVASLNEKQRKVSLKRLLGNLGYQILESDKIGVFNNTVQTKEELYDLIAYNVSDVVNLKELFFTSFYRSKFELKKGLLEKYPELVYEKKADAYEPDIRPTNVKRNRLTINTTSAKFATMSLCPYGELMDDSVVSFLYPSKRKAEEQGIEQVNVLEQTKEFFYQHFSAFPKLTKKFDKIYNYYKSIEGKNFNDSKAYFQHYKIEKTITEKWEDDDGHTVIESYPEYVLPEELIVQDIDAIPKDDNNLFYYYADGTPTTCFVTFSVGGIHGQEANLAQFEKDYTDWEEEIKRFEEIRALYPDPLKLRKEKEITLPSTGEIIPWNKIIRSGMTIKKMEEYTEEERIKQQDLFYRTPTSEKPVLFKKLITGDTALNKAKYAYTSFGHVNHGDFTSYYPNLLRQMEAFYNKGLGYDRYGEIFEEKEHFGKLRKDKTKTKEQRAFYNNQREGTKLILNSASGAANAKHDNAIKMANRIISMRIIGQLFTYRVGEEQALAGAKIISTNTDGLYSIMDEKENAKILKRMQDEIHVKIEPDPMFLISKDANNRLEMAEDGTVLSTAGGSLACYEDTSPLASLTHPAIIDWALGEYLIMASHDYKSSMNKPFNRELGKAILEKAFETFDTPHLLRMLQNIITSSVGSSTYNFAIDPKDPTNVQIIQHANRTFIMKDNTPNTVYIQAARAKKISPQSATKRRNTGERAQQHDDTALTILAGNGISPSAIPSDHEAAIQKVTNIEPNWNIFIENKSLFTLPKEEISYLLENIDKEKYLNLLQDSFEKNWKNTLPEGVSENKATRKDIYDDI